MDSRQEITATVKEQTDIVKIIGEHVDLKKSGVRYLGLCPFHGEKTPSFSVHGAQQFFHCFGCGESGDVFSFVMKYHNMDFPSALEMLASRLNIQLPEKKLSSSEKKREEERKEMFGLVQKAAKLYHRYIMEDKDAAVAREYLLDRGISDTVWKQFELGYAPSKEKVGWNYLASRFSEKEKVLGGKVGLLVKNERGSYYDKFRDRILFPIFDGRGRICGFGGRIVGDGQPKYMNSPESIIYNKSSLLLGLYQHADEIRRKRQAVIVEGNFDMISLVANSITNVVAPLGTALTARQIRLVNRYAEEIILLFDGDDAGRKAVLRAAPLVFAEEAQAKVAMLPDGHDPDTFVGEYGPGALLELIEDSEEMSEFVIKQLINEHGMTLEGKTRIAEKLIPLVDSASSALKKSVIVSHFAQKLGIDPKQLQDLCIEKPGGTSTGLVNTRPIPKVSRGAESLEPAQKRLIQFMILYPQYFDDLDKRGLRSFLQGGMGEILYLQTQLLINKDIDIQPEDILSALPDGAEKKLVTDILLGASEIATAGGDNEQLELELEELIEWLENSKIRKLSKEMDEKILKAQQANDFQALQEALLEKQRLEKELRELNAES